jgi:hypothetical protein
MWVVLGSLSAACILVIIVIKTGDRHVIKEDRQIPLKTKDEDALASSLKASLHKPLREIVSVLDLGANPMIHLIDEPPGVLRGVAIYKEKIGRVELYIRKDDPNYKKDCVTNRCALDELGGCRIGGIMLYPPNGYVIVFGEDFPVSVYLNANK